MPIYISAILVICYIILAPFVGALVAGLDRIFTARMQGRQGPPLLQPIYDIKKLFSKKTVVVNHIQLVYLGTFLFFIVFTGALFYAGLDLLLVLFSLTTANIFLVIAATSSNSPYASMGAQRELIQMLTYEPMILLVAVGFYVSKGSFNVSDLITRHNLPAIVSLPGVFVAFLIILIIKFRKHPFDLSTSHHAHQEMVKGLTTEFSGTLFGLLELAHWYENVFLLGLIALFFVNGSVLSFVLAVVATAVCYFILTLIDNTNARLKWDKMFVYVWLLTLILGATNIFVLQIMF